MTLHSRGAPIRALHRSLLARRCTAQMYPMERTLDALHAAARRHAATGRCTYRCIAGSLDPVSRPSSALALAVARTPGDASRTGLCSELEDTAGDATAHAHRETLAGELHTSCCTLKSQPHGAVETLLLHDEGHHTVVCSDVVVAAVLQSVREICSRRARASPRMDAPLLPCDGMRGPRA
mmetsp:Transcript_17048/g.51113  ORF Transcript_17048/g.51113 Transcript_17048/m.51113 type:complete len:180 (-) Transcript_17048:27-566(-)